MTEQPIIELLNDNNIEEVNLDFTPKTFDDYLGQDELKKKLKIYTLAAKQRQEPLDHLLIFGPPGLGKTTLAQIMANEMEVSIKICSGPTLERTGDLVAILSSLNPRDIFFIDEIHRMPANVEEVLYSAMEQFKVDVIIGQGAGARSVNLPIQPFTLVGATTKSGMISGPLRSRFGINERLDFYDEETLTKIVEQNAKFLKIKIVYDACKLIARSSRGTPRIAKKLLRRIRDFAQVENKNSADTKLVENSLNALGIDEQGLSKVDNLILKKLVENFNGGPAGLDTIAALIGEDTETIETVYEPYLLRQGLLEKTSRGRQIPYKILPKLKQKFMGIQSIF
ncbi:Holliday junction DNA helicase RuvB [candidate division TM6 bacterium RIFCSPHIGHO2_12_FULL_32_22]|nr:MAG: Holliday junction DNA helicase RuvB [candidate division TM6 bacterium RIFCSPHIGHO2_12_FULL_32_22]